MSLISLHSIRELLGQSVQETGAKARSVGGSSEQGEEKTHLRLLTETLASWRLTYHLQSPTNLVSYQKLSHLISEILNKHQRDPNLVARANSLPNSPNLLFSSPCIIMYSSHHASVVEYSKASISNLTGTAVDGEIEIHLGPVILYGCVGWGYAAGTHIKKLQTVQNKVLRTITGTDIRTRVDHLHEITKTKTLQEIFKERREMFYKQSAEHENPLIRKLGNYDPHDRRSYKRPRLLFFLYQYPTVHIQVSEYCTLLLLPNTSSLIQYGTSDRFVNNRRVRYTDNRQTGESHSQTPFKTIMRMMEQVKTMTRVEWGTLTPHRNTVTRGCTVTCGTHLSSEQETQKPWKKFMLICVPFDLVSELQPSDSIKRFLDHTRYRSTC
uniref:Uncharacterized protein n=1 Tax=Timema cristinae TaxID=61476 RepID=A0A7R9GR78_TIMCR|nr:unnamed protein product [Timema cristinae]